MIDKLITIRCTSELNSRPVIFLTLKNCSGGNISEMSISLAKSIRSEYLRYNGIFSDTVDRQGDDYFAFYQIYTMLRKIGNEVEENAKSFGDDEVKIALLKSALTELIKAVSIFYNKKVLVLIDEYDQPLIKAHEMGYRKAFSKGVYGSFLGSALKSNDYLDQALLTGIQRVAKESIFSEVNNFVVYTVVDEIYASYFGLTESETTKILEDYGYLLTDEIKNYYDGYTFGGVDIYNPWSILSFLNKGTIQPYWLNTSTNGLIRELVPHEDRDFLEEFETLIKDGQVEAYVSLEASFFELEEPETLWGLLVNSGYLTVVKDLGDDYYLLRLPNQEVKREFRSLVAKYTKIKIYYVEKRWLILYLPSFKKFMYRMYHFSVINNALKHRNNTLLLVITQIIIAYRIICNIFTILAVQNS